MKTFAIKDLEHYSGVKSHTLRIWEQRYQFLSPKRTSTNIRIYGLKDFSKILQVALLNTKGIRISTLSKMDTPGIETAIKKFALQSEVFHHQQIINDLICCMFKMDIEGFEQLLSRCDAMMETDKFINKIVVRFLEKICLRVTMTIAARYILP